MVRKRLQLLKKKKNKIEENTKKFKIDFSWYREIKNFIEVIKRKNKIIYEGGFNEAYETMRVIDLIYRSDKLF